MLVAEDNPVNQVVIQRLLERLEVRVRVASDGAECIEAGMNEHVAKPIDMATLERVVASFVHERAAS